MTMRASLIITAKDQASAAFGRVAAGARKLGASFRPVQQEARSADRAIDKVGQRAPSHFARAGKAALKLARDMKIAERAAYGVGYAIGASSRKAGQLALSAAKWGAAAGAAGAAFGIGSIIGGAIRVGAQFEQFEVTLRTVMGSAKAAKDAMAWVQKFAERTPFELADVMAAFVKLKTYGIDGTDGSLRVMGDTAAAMGRSLDEAVEAMADAMTGEFERLKGFGIRASQQGDKVTLSWRKNGKELTKTVRKSGLDIKAAVSSIWGSQFAGAGDAQSRTFNGMISNLKDQWAGFQKQVADAGIFDLVKAKLQSVLEWANKAAADGRMKKWAEQISAGLENAVGWATQFFENTEWKQVREDAVRIADAVWTVAQAFASVVEHASLAAKIVNTINPFSGGVLGFAYRRITEQSAAVPGRGSSTRATPKPAGTNAAPRAWRAPLGGGARSAAPAKQMPARPAAGRSAGRSAERDVNVGGKVTVEVRTAPGVQARTTQVQSNNRRVPVQVNTGRSMAGAA